MQPLTDDEAALLYTVVMCGQDAYPIQKYGTRWLVGPWRGWIGFPTCHRTRKAAREQFEGWERMARERWAEMRQAHPGAILTAVGVRYA